jgi:hypothetical protein
MSCPKPFCCRAWGRIWEVIHSSDSDCMIVYSIQHDMMPSFPSLLFTTIYFYLFISFEHIYTNLLHTIHGSAFFYFNYRICSQRYLEQPTTYQACFIHRAFVEIHSSERKCLRYILFLLLVQYKQIDYLIFCPISLFFNPINYKL